jgi:hypothetical protein
MITNWNYQRFDSSKFKFRCEDRPGEARAPAELQRNAGEVKAPSLAVETTVFKPPTKCGDRLTVHIGSKLPQVRPISGVNPRACSPSMFEAHISLPVKCYK